MLKFLKQKGTSSLARTVGRARLRGPGYEVSEVDWSAWEDSVSGLDGGGVVATAQSTPARWTAPVQHSLPAHGEHFAAGPAGQHIVSRSLEAQTASRPPLQGKSGTVVTELEWAQWEEETRRW